MECLILLGNTVSKYASWLKNDCENQETLFFQALQCRDRYRAEIFFLSPEAASTHCHGQSCQILNDRTRHPQNIEVLEHEGTMTEDFDSGCEQRRRHPDLLVVQNLRRGPAFKVIVIIIIVSFPHCFHYKTH